jgi:hypothetical protein
MDGIPDIRKGPARTFSIPLADEWIPLIRTNGQLYVQTKNGLQTLTNKNGIATLVGDR